jgi:hypothetical protein
MTMEKIYSFFNSRFMVGLVRNSFPILLLLFSIQSYGQSLACNGSLNVSLDLDCEAEITADMMLEGSYPGTGADYTIEISGITGNTVSAPGVYTVRVTYNPTGNRCWGNILVEDKLAPLIESCPCSVESSDPDCQFLCSDLQGILNGTIAVPRPIVVENCDDYQSYFTDVVTDGACGEKIVTRTWRFEDNSGNISAPCLSVYRLAAIGFDDITPPNNEVTLHCGANTSPKGIYDFFLPTLGHTGALMNAWPSVNGVALTEYPLCNLIASRTDTEIPACGVGCNSVKVLRNWTVIDWCTSQIRIYAQIISAKDTIPPVLTAADITTSTGPWTCDANIVFPLPTSLTDNCDANPKYRVTGPAGIQILFNVPSQRFIAYSVPKGIHTFNYIAEDCCGNTSTTPVTVSVFDKTPPVAIAKEFIVVSLTNSGNNEGGIAKIFPHNVDNGSYDACSNVYLEIRRDSDNCDILGNDTYSNRGNPFDYPLDPDHGQHVKFCCNDLKDVENGVAFGIVKVWLRVWDDADMDGVFGSAGDNYNETWAMVRVEDKLPPVIVCPDPVEIDCWDDPNDLSKVGSAVAFGNCGNLDVEYVDIPYLDHCGIGYIHRRWFVVTRPQVLCYQYIYVSPTDPFTEENIQWPPLEITTDCTEDASHFKPTWTPSKCGLIGYSIKSDTFRFDTDGSCLKILNTYTIIDWCQHDPNNPQSGGKWSRTQVIKVIDDVAPILLDCEDEMFETDGSTCELDGIRLCNTAVDEGDCASDWIRWTVLVDLFDNGSFDYEYSSFFPSSNTTFNDYNGNGIPDRYVAPTNSGQEVHVRLPIAIPGGSANHRVVWKATDGCGNHTTCTRYFMVTDKKKPTPYCVHISSALMIDGTVEIWASDFDLGSFDNCTAQEDLLFTFNNEYPVLDRLHELHYFKGQGQAATLAEYRDGIAQQWRPEFNSSAKVFNCDDLPFSDVVMTVWDEEFNFDFCVVRLSLLDNQGACGNGQTGSISGSIYTSKGTAIDAVDVVLDGTISEVRRESTDNQGYYVFFNAPIYHDYALNAERNDNPLNGVSTLDLVLIQRHLLNQQLFESPYQIIAADVNNDERISTADLVELRRLILGLNIHFQSNKSWRFVNEAFVFDNPQSPWPFDENIMLPGFDQSMNNQNFIGVKIGDVNYSAVANATENNLESRSGNFRWFVENQQLSKGNEISIPVYAAQETDLYGFQMEFKASNAEFLGLKSGQLNLQESHWVRSSTESIKISFDAANGATLNTQEPAFFIQIRSAGNAKVSEVLSVSPAQLSAEAYVGNDLNIENITLSFRSDIINDELSFELLQNQPNPYIGSTTIGFTLPNDGAATLSVYDVSGRMLFERTASYSKGYNQITLNRENFSSPGVLYYKLESGEFTATKKMIEIE